jgi:tripartite-type tricarboxylate transporter receptor subunit TctC
VFLFNHMAGVDAVDVTYKDTSGAMTDVMTGRLDYFVAPLVGALAAKDKLRVLAVTSAERSAMLPDVPSMAEAGLPVENAVGAASRGAGACPDVRP